MGSIFVCNFCFPFLNPSLFTYRPLDSFYHLLKKPSPPSKGRKNSTSGRRDSNNSVRRKRSISDGEEKRKSSLIGRIGSGIGSVLKKVK
jgi:hypothetical protein